MKAIKSNIITNEQTEESVVHLEASEESDYDVGNAVDGDHAHPNAENESDHHSNFGMPLIVEADKAE